MDITSPKFLLELQRYEDKQSLRIPNLWECKEDAPLFGTLWRKDEQCIRPAPCHKSAAADPPHSTVDRMTIAIHRGTKQTWLMENSRGFTLIELIVTIAIVAVLTSLAAPSMVNVMRTTAVASSVNGMMADLRYARSEAVRRGSTVIMCRSDDPEASSPSCKTDGGTDFDGDSVKDGWVSGWFVFVDRNDNGLWDSGEPILRVQSKNTSAGTIAEGVANTSTVFKYSSTGRLLGLTAAVTLTVGSSKFSDKVKRKLCINMIGQTKIAGDGTSSCS
jgi:type IV fimbrial biogenesis protein FimT